jgi:phage terminase large subunit-like protein
MDKHDLIKQALASQDPKALDLAFSLINDPLFRFEPRADQPELLDQQTSFYTDQFPGIACVVAGNGSGKSYCCSAKLARFIQETPPPEPNTPVWVISQTMEVVTKNCWGQNLKNFIPPDRIKSVVWYREGPGWPRLVVLKPHANGNNYVIEFKSYDQGRQALQAANIAAFMLDEQCPMDLLNEVLARTRKWNYPGSKLYTLTPIEPDPDLEERFSKPDQYPTWRFYRMNTRVAAEAGHVTQDYVKHLEENEIPGLVETRLTGAFARYEGMVYPSFGKDHIIDPIKLEKNWLRIRGLDLGWNHGTACIWAARDHDGRYYVYREYNRAQTSIEDHVNAINGPGDGLNPEAWDDYPNKGSTYADPANPQVLHEFAQRGLATVIANKDREAGFATVRSLLRPGPDGKPMLVVFNNCTTLINQMRQYVYDRVTGKPIKETDNRLFDTVDALRYVCHSYQMDTQIRFTPAKVPERTRKLGF